MNESMREVGISRACWHRNRYEEGGCDRGEDWITELLTDVRHYASSVGVDFEKSAKRSGELAAREENA